MSLSIDPKYNREHKVNFQFLNIGVCSIRFKLALLVLLSTFKKEGDVAKR